MIPDKIYIGTVTLSSNEPGELHALHEWQVKPYRKVRNTEYIRKEALLEFVNKKLQESADRLDFRTNRAYAELLDKLNSL